MLSDGDGFQCAPSLLACLYGHKPERYSPNRLVAVKPTCCTKSPYRSIRTASPIMARLAARKASHPYFDILVLVASKNAPNKPSRHPDRKSGVTGKRVSERVDLGGRRRIKKKKTK